MKKIVLVSVISIFLLFVTGCTGQKVVAEPRTETYKSVQTQKIKIIRTEEILNYTGTVKLVTQKNIASKYGGRLIESFTKEGDLVEEGQLLAVVDTTDLSLQLSSIQAKMTAAQKEANVQKASYDYYSGEQTNAHILYEEGIITKSAVDKADFVVTTSQLSHEASWANYNQLSAEKKRLTAMVEEGSIYADSAGVVDKVFVEISEFVSPTQPIYTLSLKDKQVTTFVTGKDINRIQVGQKAYLNVDGKQYEGTVAYIDDSADPQTHSFKVKIGFDESRLAIGAVVGVNFVVGKQEGIWIPLQSIQSTTIDFVYLVKDERATRRSIQIIEIVGDEVLIEGLDVDDFIVTSGMKSLLEGMLVKDSNLKVD